MVCGFHSDGKPVLTTVETSTDSIDRVTFGVGENFADKYL